MFYSLSNGVSNCHLVSISLGANVITAEVDIAVSDKIDLMSIVVGLVDVLRVALAEIGCFIVPIR